MFNINKIEVGDLIYYKSEGIIGNLIGWFSGYSISHVSGISEIEGKNIKIIESHFFIKDDQGILRSGVIEKTFNINKWKDKVFVRRVVRYSGTGIKFGLNQMEKKELIDYMRKNLVNKVKYDLGSFPSKFFRSRICRWLGLTSWRKGNPILNNVNAYDCMEIWGKAYKEVFDINITPGINYQSATPADGYKSLSQIDII